MSFRVRRASSLALTIPCVLYTPAPPLPEPSHSFPCPPPSSSFFFSPLSPPSVPSPLLMSAASITAPSPAALLSLSPQTCPPSPFASARTANAASLAILPLPLLSARRRLLARTSLPRPKRLPLRKKPRCLPPTRILLRPRPLQLTRLPLPPSQPPSQPRRHLLLLPRLKSPHLPLPRTFLAI
jgi:hypothetical protein